MCLAAPTAIALWAEGVDTLSWNPIGWALLFLTAVLAAIVGVALFSPALAVYLAFELVVLRVAAGRGAVRSRSGSPSFPSRSSSVTIG